MKHIWNKGTKVHLNWTAGTHNNACITHVKLKYGRQVKAYSSTVNKNTHNINNNMVTYGGNRFFCHMMMKYNKPCVHKTDWHACWHGGVMVVVEGGGWGRVEGAWVGGWVGWRDKERKERKGDRERRRQSTEEGEKHGVDIPGIPALTSQGININAQSPTSSPAPALQCVFTRGARGNQRCHKTQLIVLQSECTFS